MGATRYCWWSEGCQGQETHSQDKTKNSMETEERGVKGLQYYSTLPRDDLYPFYIQLTIYFCYLSHSRIYSISCLLKSNTSFASSRVQVGSYPLVLSFVLCPEPVNIKCCLLRSMAQLDQHVGGLLQTTLNFLFISFTSCHPSLTNLD